jgi:plasmid stabilization system protein ParE
MFEVAWLPEAQEDLERHFAALNPKNPEAASRAVKAILRAASSLAVSANRGVAVPGTLERKLPVAFGRYGYVIYYRVVEQRVYILQIYHGRENRP